MTILMLLAACGAPPEPEAHLEPEVPPPTYAPTVLALPSLLSDDLAGVRLAVGLAAKDDPSRCAALDAVLAVVPPLQQHLDQRRAAVWGTPEQASYTAAIENLQYEIPGLLVADDGQHAAVSVDFAELGRAFGTSPATTALVSAAAFVGRTPVWQHSTGCTDLEAARQWTRRLDPTFAKAPECLQHTLAPRVQAELERLAATRCFCGEAEATAELAGRVANQFESLKTIEGKPAASALRTSVGSDDAHFGCTE